jgi:hypothetical protein
VNAVRLERGEPLLAASLTPRLLLLLLRLLLELLLLESAGGTVATG